MNDVPASAPDGLAHRAIIDVDTLVADLQERARQRREEGHYDRRALTARLDVRPGQITLRPEVAYSAKPVIGPVITGAKRLLIRLQYHFLDDVVAQTNRALDLARAQTAAEIQRRQDLEERLAELEARVAASETPRQPGSGEADAPTAPPA